MSDVRFFGVLMISVSNRPTSLVEACALPRSCRSPTNHVSHGGVDAQPLGVVDIFITGQSAVDRLTEQRYKAMLLVLAKATILHVVCTRLCQCQRLVELSVRQQPGVSGDLAAHEPQLQTAIEIDPQLPVLAVTHRVFLSAWHESAKYLCFSGFRRKSHAKPAGLIWEMRAYIPPTPRKFSGPSQSSLEVPSRVPPRRRRNRQCRRSRSQRCR